MGRRKIEIKRIEDSHNRYTTFSKRKLGIFSKARALCSTFDAEAAVITFTKAGNLFTLGHPDVDSVVNRYLSYPNSSSPTGSNNKEMLSNLSEQQVSAAEVMIGKVLGKAKGKAEWRMAVEKLGFCELYELEAAVRRIKTEVSEKVEEIEGSGKVAC